jgi:hypothetical protein
MGRWLFMLSLLCALGAVGCGGPPPPATARTNAVAAMRSARTIGAEREPRAAYHLELARETLALADRQIASGQMIDAERSLVRAEADAVLAISLTREAEMRAAARATQQRIAELRVEQ